MMPLTEIQKLAVSLLEDRRQPDWAEKAFRLAELCSRTPKRFHCIDCNGHAEMYMIHDELWNSALPDWYEMKRVTGHIYCCFSCLEKRIGRELTKEDFTNAPINDPIHFGIKLGRQGRKKMDIKKRKELQVVCCKCKQIRVKERHLVTWKGRYEPKQGDEFSHGLCPSCYIEETAPHLSPAEIAMIRKTGVIPE